MERRRPVVNLPPARTVLTTAPELGIERVKEIGAEVARLALANDADVFVNILPIATDGALAALALVEQLVDGGGRARYGAG